MQAQQKLLPLLFAFSHQNYSRYLTIITSSLTGRKFSTIPGDLVTEVTVNQEVNICGGLMQGGYSTSVETVDDFIFNSHALAKLWRALKNRMNVKTSSNHKKFSTGRKKCMSIQQLLTTIPTNLFHGPVQNIMSGLEISAKIIDGLLTAKGTGEKLI